MKVFIVGDQDLITSRIRQILLHEGYDCPLDQVLLLNQAVQQVPRWPADLLVVVLSPQPERALVVLAEVRARAASSHPGRGPNSEFQVGGASSPHGRRGFH